MKCLYRSTVLMAALFIVSCSRDSLTDRGFRSELTEYEQDVISYFKEIALGFEFSEASEVTRSWNDDMNIYVGGSLTQEMETELMKIVSEINDLVTDGFSIEVTNDSLQSNFYLFLGTRIRLCQNRSLSGTFCRFKLGPICGTI